MLCVFILRKGVNFLVNLSHWTEVSYFMESNLVVNINIYTGNPTLMKIIECVPNFSEGRNDQVVSDIVSVISSVPSIRILDQEMDANHNRSVITFVGEPEMVLSAAYSAIKRASELIDLNKHTGEHPRFGATDVVPFIPLGDVKMEECIKLSRDLGEKVGSELGIPVYLYGEAADLDWRKDLGSIRSKNFQYEQLRSSINEPKWKPDYGPSKIGPAGATIIGARDFLIAYNVNLRTKDLEIGKKIARALRAKDGGLTFVKSLAFYLEDKEMVQISMNLTNFRKTPVYRAFELVSLEASRFGVSIAESEVVGLIPLDAIVDSTKYYLQLNEFRSSQILEKRMWE